MSLIDVNFYKKTGKWYESCQINVDHYIFEDEFKQEIVDKQTALIDGWQNNDYYVVISDTYENNKDPNYHGFYNRLFLSNVFKGMIKKI